MTIPKPGVCRPLLTVEIVLGDNNHRPTMPSLPTRVDSAKPPVRDALEHENIAVVGKMRPGDCAPAIMSDPRCLNWTSLA